MKLGLDIVMLLHLLKMMFLVPINQVTSTTKRAYNGKLNDNNDDNEDYDDDDDEDDSADETFDNNTDITDYSDFPHQQTIASTQASSKPDQSSCQLQDLKVRLTKAKYYLQELVDSNDYRN